MTKDYTNQKCVIISTTQRCGSTWISSICGKIFQGGGVVHYVPGLPHGLLDYTRHGTDDESKVEAFSDDVRTMLTQGKRVIKTHDLPPRFASQFLDQNPNFILINVIRDFRDVMISRLMYNRYHLPSIGRQIECAFVADMAHLNDVQMVQGFYGTPEMLDWLAHWRLFNEPLAHERYLVLQYEHLLHPPTLLRHVEDIGHRLLGPQFTAERAAEIAKNAQFNEIDINLKKDRPNDEVKTAFCRKGVAGDHKRFLTKHQSAILQILTQ